MSSTADGDEADSDSSLSGSSSDPNLVGKANGVGGDLYNSEEQDMNGDVPSSNGAFDTAALGKKFSAKRPPGGKVNFWQTIVCDHLHLLLTACIPGDNVILHSCHCFYVAMVQGHSLLSLCS